jgi:hypothetical protein
MRVLHWSSAFRAQKNLQMSNSNVKTRLLFSFDTKRNQLLIQSPMRKAATTAFNLQVSERLRLQQSSEVGMPGL